MFRRSKTADGKPFRARGKRDARTLLTPEQFRLAIERECCRVDRAVAGDLSMVLFRVTRTRRWRLSTVRLIMTIFSRIRVTDDLGWFDREHLGILLPETSAAGAWKLVQMIGDALARHGARPLCTMYSYPVVERPAKVTGLVA
jgi:hypothetical protein